MKRGIVVSEILLSVLLLTMYIFKFDYEDYRKIDSLEDKFKYSLYIPSDDINNNPDNVKLLLQSASKFNINLLRRTILYDGNRSYLQDYIYISTYVNYGWKLTSGRQLTANDMDDMEVFLSTKRTVNPSQIGVIQDFMCNDFYEIYPLVQLTKEYQYTGRYYVECESDDIFVQFLKNYTELINHQFDVAFDYHNYIDSDGENRGWMKTDISKGIGFIALITLSVFFMLVLVYILSYRREMGILKLNGCSCVNIFTRLLGKDLLLAEAIFIVLSVIVVLLFQNIDCLIKWIKIYLVACLLTNCIVFVLISFMENSIDINFSIKGRKKFSFVKCYMLIFQTIITVVLLFTILHSLQLNETLQKKNASLDQWKIAFEYMKFYPLYQGDMLTEADEIDTDIAFYDFYNELIQKKEIIYCDAHDYLPMYLQSSKKFFAVKVNPNYLKRYPVYDSENEVITISESEANSIFLVPEKYKNNNYLEEAIQKEMDMYFSLQEQYYRRAIPDEARQIKIIYISDDNSAFSFIDEVFPDNKNKIAAPVFQILTKENLLIPELNFFGHNLFIPISKTSRQTYQEILPLLKKYGLQDNAPYGIRIEDEIINQIDEITKKLLSIRIASMLLFGVLLFVLYELSKSTMILYQKRMVIELLFGIRIKKAFNHLCSIISLANMLSFTLLLMLSKNILFSFFAVFVAEIIEITFIGLFLYLLMKQPMLCILKGRRGII